LPAAELGEPLVIGGIAGDQQAALFGQGCHRAGMAKNTYGTGCFMLLHTGGKAVQSSSGLIATACAQTREPEYALEGSVFVGGAVVQWLRDEMKFFSSSSEVEALANSVRDGRSFSDALNDYPAIFPALYRNMIRAGEVGGGLEQALSRLADLGEHEAELRSRLVTASVYPLFVLSFAVLITIAFLTFVIPKLSEVFVATEKMLPLPTQILLTASAVFTRWWWAILLMVVAGGVALRSWHKTPAGRAMADQMVISIPAVGVVVRRIETARFGRNLGTMVSQGVPILQALNVSAENVGNAALRRAILQTLDAVREGSSLAVALSATGQFPTFVSNMVAVGEESGTVDQALMKVAVAYERETDQAIRTLISILEPVLLVVVGGVVMGLMLAMLLPVFSIGLGVQ